MAYTVLGERDARWQPRKGLEGPFFYANGRVLYYDVKQGEYWYPLTDYYVDGEEVNDLHNHLVGMLSR